MVCLTSRISGALTTITFRHFIPHGPLQLLVRRLAHHLLLQKGPLLRPREHTRVSAAEACGG
jgi:hypothetical protein